MSTSSSLVDRPTLSLPIVDPERYLIGTKPMKELNIVIACDVDPDRDTFIPGQKPDRLEWKGMLEGIPRGKEAVRVLSDRDGHVPVFTWCLRVDHQIKQLCGSYEHVLSTHSGFLKSLEQSGDELGWHPHFWRRDDQAGKWYQELADPTFQIQMLEEAFAAFKRILPDGAVSARMGWAYHNNETYATMARLGVKIECSAIPGMRILPPNDQIHDDGYYDWYGTPDEPYYPSSADFRRPPRPGEAEIRLLEVPVFMTHSLVWGLFAGAILSRKKKTLSPLTGALKRPSYIVNITGKPALFSPILSALNRRLSKAQKTTFLTYFHADELVENAHPVYKLEHMLTNLKSVLAAADRHDVAVKFMRIRDLEALY
jgi:hypothetical protein